MEVTADLREADHLIQVHWPHLHCVDGDTLVVVDYPTNRALTCAGLPWAKAQLIMSSEALRATGSSVFIDGLSERQQKRYRWRQRDNPLAVGKKYVFDLTPSLEGEDAAFLVAELSLPQGIRDWWMSKDRFGVSQLLVSGHDDDCHNHHSVPVNCQPTPDWVRSARNHSLDARKYRIDLGLQSIVPCPAREILDYCEIRHRANIVRLLLLIAGYDLVLDSAPRVYTIVALAKQFDVVHLVSSQVRVWLEDHRNSSFIDIHPEIALEMAWKLQLSDLARAALRILVVEGAIEPGDAQVGSITKFGRPRASLSDDINEVVQHATNSVRDRCKEAVGQLFSVNALGWIQVPAWGALVRIGDIIEADTRMHNNHPLATVAQTILGQYYQVRLALIDYVKNAVEHSSNAVPVLARLEEIDNDRLAYAVGGPEFRDLPSIINGLPNEHKVLMPFFWEALKQYVSDWDAFYQWVGPDLSLPHAHLGSRMIAFTLSINDAMAVGLFPSLRARFSSGVSVNPNEFHDQIKTATGRTWREWNPISGDLEAPLYRTTHLALGFTEDEFRFLPLWAGGLDDGTGAVFDNMTVPDTDMGPVQPGPSYVTGKTVAPSSTADSDTTIIGGGISVQAAHSRVDTSAGNSNTGTESFVGVSASESSHRTDSFDLISESNISLREGLRDMGILSDTGRSDTMESVECDNRNTLADAASDVAGSDDLITDNVTGRSDTMEYVEDDDNNDAADGENEAAESDDLVTDSDTSGWDSEWSDIYD